MDEYTQMEIGRVTCFLTLYYFTKGSQICYLWDDILWPIKYDSSMPMCPASFHEFQDFYRNVIFYQKRMKQV